MYPQDTIGSVNNLLNYCLVGSPGWKGQVPEGMEEIKAPTALHGSWEGSIVPELRRMPFIRLPRRIFQESLYPVPTNI